MLERPTVALLNGIEFEVTGILNTICMPGRGGDVGRKVCGGQRTLRATVQVLCTVPGHGEERKG